MKRGTFLTRISSVLGIAAIGNHTVLSSSYSKQSMTLADIPKDIDSFCAPYIAAVYTCNKLLGPPKRCSKLRTWTARDSEIHLLQPTSGGWWFKSLRWPRSFLGLGVKSPQFAIEKAIKNDEVSVYMFSTFTEFLDFASNWLKENPTKLDLTMNCKQ